MSENTQQPDTQAPVVQNDNNGGQQPSHSDSLRESFFEGTAMPIPPVKTEPPAQKQDAPPPPPDNEEIIDLNEWYKREGWESEDAFRNEIKELRELKNKKFEFEAPNEDSKKFYEAFKEGKVDDLVNIWNQKKHIEKLLTNDVDEKTAEQIIKFSIKNKYSEFSDADVERKFNKQYNIPAKPKESDYTLDEEYQEAVNQWKEQVAEIKQDMIMDAKVIRPDLQKLNNELVLPDIKGQNEQRQPTQEELAKVEENIKGFLQNAKSVNDAFNGFSVSVKDKDVDYTVDYTLSPEEKSSVYSTLETFAKSNFDANEIFAKRWVSEKDGVPVLNTDLMIKDLSKILVDEKSMYEKLAKDSAAKRMESYLKEKKNIDIRSTDGTQHSQPLIQDKSEKLRESFFEGV